MAMSLSGSATVKGESVVRRPLPTAKGKPCLRFKAVNATSPSQPEVSCVGLAMSLTTWLHGQL